MRRKWIITVLLLGVSMISFSQGTIKGKLIDSIAKQPMSLATITVFKAKDTSIVTYRLSDPQGNFKVPGLPLDVNLRTVITSSGYKVIRRNFTLTSENAVLDLGTINVMTDTTSLDEFLVVAERPPVTVRNDTIEFNASSFKTLPTALVEDLLKKFPGVEIAANGSIKVNGRVVNRILVDGRDFFGGDPKIATRNLPADLIDKVQVMDDKEQLEKDPSINKSELGQVINLKFKKSIKKGWFGKAYAGGGRGSSGHYETGSIINSFRDTLQVSMLGYTNNLNKSGFGFEDLSQLGGFDRSGYNSIANYSGGGIALDDISFGGTEAGIQKSSGAGININHDPSKKVQLNFKYFTGNIKSEYSDVTRVQQILQDTTLTTLGKSTKNKDSWNHRISTNVKWKMDSLSYINFNSSLSLSRIKSKQKSFSESGSNFDPLLNNSDNMQQRHSTGNEFEYSFNYFRSFRKQKGSFFVNQYLTAGLQDNTIQNDVISTFYKGGIASSALNQSRNQGNSFAQAGLYFDFYRMFSKYWSLSVTNSLYWYNGQEKVRTYDLNPITGQYELLNPVLSNGLNHKVLRNSSGLKLSWKYKDWVVSPGFDWQYSDINNLYEKAVTIKQQFKFLLPSFGIRWKSFGFSYRVYAQTPRPEEITPLIDNSNPLYLILGNPDLQPSKTHQINSSFSKFDTKRQLNYDFYTSLRIITDNVVRERMVSTDGVQVTKPVNLGDAFKWYNDFSMSKQFKFSRKWQLTVRPGLRYNFNGNYIKINSIKSATRYQSADATLNFNFNWNDIFEFTNEYTINGTKINYEDNAFRNTNITTKNISAEVIIRTPKRWVWETSVNYRHIPDASNTIPEDLVQWNAGLNFLFLKEQKGQLKLFVYDILKQNVNSYRTVSENYILESNSTTLTRYLLLTFTYNIRDFKGGKVGGDKSLFSF